MPASSRTIRLAAALAALAPGSAAFADPQPASVPAFARFERSGAAAFETAEYRANVGLSLINASTAYAAGWTGAGSLIAVIDNGFQTTHPDLSPQIVQAIRPSTGGAVPTASHGTHVAGIAGAARDGTGMHGVAYGARLSLYTYGNDAGGDALAFDFAARLRPTVISNSWGIDTAVGVVTGDPAFASDPYQAIATRTSDTTANWRAFVSSVRKAQEHSVVVFAASNQRLADIDVSAGLPLIFPELRGPWLAVVNVDANGVLQSVHCGSAAQFCLAGPGTNIYSTEFGLTYSVKSGTSMATPHVSGAVAIARQMFPRAAPAELASLVLQTATDIGAPGVDDQFGWGMLNLGNIAATIDPRAAGAFAFASAGQFDALGQFGSALAGQLGPMGVAGPAPAASGPPEARYASLRLDERGASLAMTADRAGAVWATGFHGRARLGAGPATPGSRSRVNGFVAGVDLFATESWRFGVAAGFSRSNVRAPGSADSGEARGLHLAAYADWTQGGFFARAVGQIGLFEQSFVRRSIPGAAGTAATPVGRSEASSVAGEIDGRFGATLDLGGHALQPYLSAVARWRRTDAFSETGAGVFSLDVPRSSLAQLEIGPGVRWTSPAFDLGAASARLGVDLGYARLLGEVAPGFDVELLGSRIAALGVDPGRDVLRVGSDVTLAGRDGRLSATFGWSGRFQRRAESHTLSARLRLAF